MAPAKGKKVAPAPFAARKNTADKPKANPLFEAKPRKFGIGQDIQPTRNLSRFVKWPEYVRLQRQRKVLRMRLKVPPAINQFTHTLDGNKAAELFKLSLKYRPESKKEKATRLKEAAEKVANGGKADAEKPFVVKYGINHITSLVESKKASLVVIAHDVDPIEIVLWLPALCRKMGVPYVIVKGKARLGHIVHKKTATALAFTEVRDEDKQTLAKLVDVANAEFVNKEDTRRRWGGGIMGAKSQAVTRKREAAANKPVKATV
ncbi:60S ribosomal protein L8 [Mycoemilia scoparia]|uniref:60S ribosomal protein L8 n=1 Tax=Mycoemilia scoparia TaxID=417184 RepID=A0A9W8DQR0_9FUNG|nr:60S ribosomal protein L8 [Mycoemilia scoparia]